MSTALAMPLPASAPGVLDVDPTDPFYFDHPLDHVPGILLFIGLLDRVQAARRQPAAGLPGTNGGAGDAGQLVAAFTFGRFCELDAPIGTCVEPDEGARAWTAEAIQSGAAVCTGTVCYETPRREAGPFEPAPAPPAQPAPGPLVHRARPENVLVGVPDRSETTTRVALLNPPEGQLLRRRSHWHRTAEEMVEGARQLGVLLWQHEYGRAADARLLLEDLQCRLPCTLPRDLRLELRWRRQPRRGNAARFSIELASSGTGERLGTVVFGTRVMSEAVYRRLRGIDA